MKMTEREFHVFKLHCDLHKTKPTPRAMKAYGVTHLCLHNAKPTKLANKCAYKFCPKRG